MLKYHTNWLFMKISHWYTTEFFSHNCLKSENQHSKLATKTECTCVFLKFCQVWQIWKLVPYMREVLVNFLHPYLVKGQAMIFTPKLTQQYITAIKLCVQTANQTKKLTDNGLEFLVKITSAFICQTGSVYSFWMCVKFSI